LQRRPILFDLISLAANPDGQKRKDEKSAADIAASAAAPKADLTERLGKFKSRRC